MLLRLFSGREHLYANSSLGKLVCRYVGDTTVEGLGVPALVVVTNMETREPAVFYQLHCHPGCLPANIGGVEHLDGVMMFNCGLETAWNHVARRVVVIW